MTEKEKMLKGQLYFSMDEELVADRERCQELLYDFNHTRPGEQDKRLSLLQKLLKTEKEVFINSPFFCDYGYNIEAGVNFYANFGCVILDVNRVIIGDNVMFGPNVQVYTATHPTGYKERISGKELGLPITIGDNVWIGGGSVILPNITIGSNTTIGAGSVVTKEIPANVVAAGNPCRVIKELPL